MEKIAAFSERLRALMLEKGLTAAELSRLEVDLVLGFRDLDGNDKYFLLEYIKKRQG